MDIVYSNKNLELLFSDLYSVSQSKNLLIRKIGCQLARTAKKRVNQIHADITFESYLSSHIGNPHSLTGTLKEYYGVDLSKNVRLIIQPVPNDKSAEALAECTTAKIIGIVDYHGDKYEWSVK